MFLFNFGLDYDYYNLIGNNIDGINVFDFLRFINFG